MRELPGGRIERIHQGGNDVSEGDFFEVAAYRACGDVLAMSKAVQAWCEKRICISN